MEIWHPDFVQIFLVHQAQKMMLKMKWHCLYLYCFQVLTLDCKCNI